MHSFRENSQECFVSLRYGLIQTLHVGHAMFHPGICPKTHPRCDNKAGCSYSSFAVRQIALITNEHPDGEDSRRGHIATPRKYWEYEWAMKEDFSGMVVFILDIVTDG